MQNEESQKVIHRFFQVVDTLIEAKVIKSVLKFTQLYGINYWNFATNKKSPERDMFQLEWFNILVREYGVNAHWLLTGEGKMFTPEYRFFIDKKIKEVAAQKAISDAKKKLNLKRGRPTHEVSAAIKKLSH